MTCNIVFKEIIFDDLVLRLISSMTNLFAQDLVLSEHNY